MTQTHYTSRTPVQQYQRCKRMRWLATAEGATGVGLEPRRKSLHLVLGSAVHAGMEVLLREGQQWLDKIGSDLIIEVVGATGPQPATLEYQLNVMFRFTTARQIEDRAVAAALADLAKEYDAGVELDPEEAAAASQANNLVQITGLDILKGQLRGSLAQADNGAAGADSPIVIDFADFYATGPTAKLSASTTNLPSPSIAEATDTSLGNGVAVASVPPQQQEGAAAAEDYLREELAALTEGMVRAWARRRWRGLLEQFEVLEVEREGEWRLAEWHEPHDLGCHSYNCQTDHRQELRFQSRHDALLLERTTGYLYLQSYKTTGMWDRRKELDAQVDMQGLSEGVDVERRFEEAWHRNKELGWSADARQRELVSERVADWLGTLPDPPRILGVRYEFLLKGLRKKDRKDATQPDRYVQESILCRAYKQEGITSADRRWAWTYDWQDPSGKGRRLDYRSWQKAAVWRAMPIADWIDRLDRGEIQGDALGEQGEPLDALASVFVPVVTVYRNADEALDLLEQLEAQEVQIVKDVAAVREAEHREGYAGKRSALNRLFPQTRTACSYPGLCAYRQTATQAGFCFGAPDPWHDATVLERFRERQPNHPEGGQG